MRPRPRGRVAGGSAAIPLALAFVAGCGSPAGASPTPAYETPIPGTAFVSLVYAEEVRRDVDLLSQCPRTDPETIGAARLADASTGESVGEPLGLSEVFQGSSLEEGMVTCFYEWWFENVPPRPVYRASIGVHSVTGPLSEIGRKVANDWSIHLP